MNNHKFLVSPEYCARWIVRRKYNTVAHLFLSISLFFFSFLTTIATLFSPLLSLVFTKNTMMVYDEITQNRVWLEQCDALLCNRVADE